MIYENGIDWMEDSLPSLSMCAECKHQQIMATCSAYPAGIPDRWLFTVEVHTQIEPDQQGTAVFPLCRSHSTPTRYPTMNDPQSILLLHLIGEGGSIQIKANTASLNAPVYRESNEVYDLDEDDADIPLQSTTQYSDFGAYWAVFTDSASWHLRYLIPIRRYS